ncbi:DUF3332 family protein [Leptospira sanjuanensis]|uniref:DUF3332 family protein n=1 Tax=Leptospira sanjuanensis TaxID=2879643 RepID=UPI001EE85D70|nr:DUF3332 family protein [Leptospira sanjuanensis]MCG6168598.1 DUF3332 domain-containing protein [Leptospira sanjuanensis]
MQQNKFRKAIVAILVPMILLVSFANCFGKFAIVRKFYNANEDLNIGTGMLAKMIKTILFWIPFVWLMAIGFFFDLVLFNLIEFWSGSNPIGLNEYDENGKFVKSYEEKGEKLLLSYSDFGKRLDIKLEKEGNSQNLIVFRAEPGKFFVEKNGKLEEIIVTSETVGSKTILKMAEQGKLKSTKVIDTKTLSDLEAKLASDSL